MTQESGHDTTLSAFEPVLSRIVDGVSGQDLTAKPLMVFTSMIAMSCFQFCNFRRNETLSCKTINVLDVHVYNVFIGED